MTSFYCTASHVDPGLHTDSFPFPLNDNPLLCALLVVIWQYLSTRVHEFEGRTRGRLYPAFIPLLVPMEPWDALRRRVADGARENPRVREDVPSGWCDSMFMSTFMSS